MREASKGRTVTDTDSYAFFVPIIFIANERKTAAFEMHMPEYTVESLDYATAREKNVSPDESAFLHSGEFKRIFSVKKRQATTKGVVNGYLTVRSCDTRRKIYLSYKSWSVKAGNVRLSNNNLYALGIYGESSPRVRIKKCNALIYHHQRADSLTKLAFWIGIAGCVMSVIL